MPANSSSRARPWSSGSFAKPLILSKTCLWALRSRIPRIIFAAAGETMIRYGDWSRMLYNHCTECPAELSSVGWAASHQRATRWLRAAWDFDLPSRSQRPVARPGQAAAW